MIAVSTSLFGFSRKVRALWHVLTLWMCSVMEEHSATYILDEDLVEKAQQQDPSALTVLCDRYLDRVYQFHFTRLRQQQDAEDLTSETLLKVVEKLHTYKNTGAPFGSWIFRIARNTLIDFIRKQKREASLDELPEDEERADTLDVNAIESSVLREKLWAAIESLPEKYQQLWALKLTSDLPHKEIAEILETTPGNVDVMVSRSMKRMTQSLNPTRPTDDSDTADQ